ncbi:MFS transporter [Streptomyces sp. NPDC001848]|uniref:MFS transporter n=1 Tax=Streptomyces sp. NPDC001848 TaxID=3364618 RepID=UPI003674B725
MVHRAARAGLRPGRIGLRGRPVRLHPLSLILIDAYGWRTTLVVEGVLLVALVGPLVALLLRSAPADRGLEPYGGPDLTETAEPTAGRGNVKEVLRSPLLWGLLAPFFVCGVTTTGLMDTHLVSIAHDHGASTALTGTAVSLLAAANIAGTVISGPLSDRYNCARILAVLYGTRALVLVLLALAPYGVWLVVISVAFGLVDFATVAPAHLIATRNFPAESLGLVFGLLSMAHQVGSSLGSYLPGVLHDVTGGYTPTLLGCSAALVLAMVGCLAALPGASASSRVGAQAGTAPQRLTSEAA